MLARADRGEPVDDARAVRTDEVARHDLGRIDEVDLLLQGRVQREPAQVVGSPRRGSSRFARLRFRIASDTLGVGTRMALPVSNPGKLGNRLRDRLRGARLGDDHVHRGRAAAAVTRVEVVGEVLVVRVRVHGLDVAVLDAVTVVDGFQHRRDRVRRARGSRHESVSLSSIVSWLMP